MIYINRSGVANGSFFDKFLINSKTVDYLNVEPWIMKGLINMPQ